MLAVTSIQFVPRDRFPQAPRPFVLESPDMPSTTASPKRPRRLALWLGFVLALTTLSYLGQAGDGEQAEDLAYRYDFAIAGLVVDALLLGVVFLIAWGLPWREVFALRRPERWGRSLALVGAGLVAILVVGALLNPFLDAGEEQGLVPEDWDPDRAGAFAVFAILVVVGAPIFEELTYRGLGFGLLAPYGTWLAVAVTALLFGASHGLLEGLPILVLFGVVLGVVRARTASVYPPMLLHATFNGLALATVPLGVG